MASKQQRRRGKRSDFLLAGLALAAVALGAPQGGAQQYIGQDGRMLDANTRIGSGGLNPIRPVSPLLSGNAIATGNVGRGFSFRAASPIASPYAFGAGLGTGTLSAFRRDSVGVFDSASPYGGLTPRIYYDPSQTVFTPRYLGPQRGPTAGLPAGLPPIGSRSTPTGRRLLPGSDVTRLPGQPVMPQPPLDLRTDQYIDQSLRLRSGIVDRSSQVSAALNSSIFGVDRPSLLPSPLLRASDLSGIADASGLVDLRTDSSHPIGSLPSEPLGTPLDLIIRGADLNTLLDRSRRAGAGAASLLPGLGGLQAEPQRQAGELVATQQTLALQLPISTPLGMPLVFGLDKFTDLQLAMSLSREPNAAWFGEMKKVVAANPELALDMQQIMDMDSAQFADSVVNTPIQTFVGRGDSALNEYLLRAEVHLQSRDYFDAVKQYDNARLLDPGNPLPLIGKGHASLGAGDYLSAAHSILLGLQRYPELTRMKVDLKVFMGGEAIDIRRADLMHRLEQHEDSKLRFLLGYIEYHSGRIQSGLEHLKKAAKDSPFGSLIQQYPALLTGERSLPPPKLPLAPILDKMGAARTIQPVPGIGSSPLIDKEP